jgi:hypothetical protein
VDAALRDYSRERANLLRIATDVDFAVCFLQEVASPDRRIEVRQTAEMQQTDALSDFVFVRSA